MNNPSTDTPDSQQINAQQINAQQINDWNGRTGEKWVRFQDRLDAMLAPMGEAVIKAAAIAPGESVLDIGCGCGDTSLTAAAIVGASGRVLGLDISQPMVARARERAQQAGLPAAFTVADAATHDFTGANYDLLLSRFGVMFFDEPGSAFANMRKGLKSGGRLAFVCWRTATENAWASAPMLAAMPFLPPMEPGLPGAPGPFAFADKSRIEQILKNAGFSAISIAAYDHKLPLGASAHGDPLDEALVQAMEIGPLGRMLSGLPDETRAKARAAVRDELARHVTPQGVMLAGAVWIVTAKA